MNLFNQHKIRYLLIVLVPLFLLCLPKVTLAVKAEEPFDIGIESDHVTITAKNALINELLEDISQKCQVEITGISYSDKERITCTIKQPNIEKALQVLLKNMGKTSYAFEYQGSRLSRVSVVPELKSGSFERQTKESEEFLTDENIRHFEAPDVGRRLSPHTVVENAPAFPHHFIPKEAPKKNSGEDDDTPETAVIVFQSVQNTQAEDLDIQKGDIVVEYNGIAIHEAGQLVSEVKKTNIEDEVSMLILRDGEYIDMSLNGGQIGISIQTVPIPE